MPTSLTRRLTVDGKNRQVTVPDDGEQLLYILRNQLGLKGPRFGCGVSQCGACTVLVDGQIRRSCVPRRTGTRRSPPRSAAIQVRRVVVAHDSGLVINPDGIKHQIEGNVVQGIGRALKEEVHYDARGVTSVVWEQNQFNPTPQYSVLRFSEVPSIEIRLIDRPDQPAWGAGEPAIEPMPAAIANAVYAATGGRARSLPMTPERVLSALP